MDLANPLFDPEIVRLQYADVGQQQPSDPELLLVPVDWISSWQEHLQHWKLKQLRDAERRLPPVDICVYGEVWAVRDGNHRVVAALERGEEEISAYVTVMTRM